MYINIEGSANMSLVCLVQDVVSPQPTDDGDVK